jgi:hypothetical protein
VDSPALALFAASVSFVVYLGYVLLAGMGTFWAVVWPDGQAVRRLRMVAVVGLTLIGLGTIAEALIDWLASGQVLSEIAEKSGAWLLVRLAVLAGAGFFGAELLQRPVRGGRRVTVLTLVVLLTITLVVESTALASPRVVGLERQRLDDRQVLRARFVGQPGAVLEDPPVHQPMAVLEREPSPTGEERRLDVSFSALDDVHRTHIRVGQLELRRERREQPRSVHHQPLMSLELER